MIEKNKLLKNILIIGLLYNFLQVIVYGLLGINALSGTISVIIAVSILLTNIAIIKPKFDIIDRCFIIWLLWAYLGAFFWKIPSFYFGLPASILFTLFGINIYIFVKYIQSYISYKYVIKLLILGGVLLSFFSWILRTNNGLQGERLNTDVVNGNALAYSCLLSVFALFLLKNRYRNRKKTNMLFFISFIVLNLVILWAGSRKVFLGEFVFVVLLLANRYKSRFKRSPIKVFVSVFFVIVVGFISWGAISKTTMGIRLIEAYEQEEDASSADEHLTGRGYHYVQGWQAFQEHPITGVGLGNINKYFGTRLQTHSEYISMYAETGIVGFLLYFSAYFVIIKRLNRLRKKQMAENREFYLILILSVLVILLIGFGRWNYDNFLHWAYLGLVCSFLNPKKVKHV